jgi:hypothetical protein
MSDIEQLEQSDDQLEQSDDLRGALRQAKTGLKSDVAALVKALENAPLCIPLREHVAGIETGEQMTLDRDLALSPHLLADPSGQLACVAFSNAELLRTAGDNFAWTTDGEDLEYCTLPARIALGMALNVIDDEDVIGIVFNPGDESELFLRRQELGSILQHRPLPLVGYIQGISADEEPATLVAEPGDPPPPELVQALETAVASFPEVVSHALRRTFNPERDLEPHLTLALKIQPNVDREHIANGITEAILDKLPPPGYIDVVFET